ncbi:MAG: Calx-beta domain-containing protein, partial [Verrucomicrobiales bacterium]
VGYSTIPNNESRVRVHERNWGGEDQWGQVTTLQPHWDLWRHFLDIDAGRVAISVSGRAYIYERAESAEERWSLQAEIELPSQVSSVALSGDWLLVGCVGLFSSQGGVIAYHRELIGGSEEWVPVHVLASPSPQQEFFGYTMSAEGADLVVGTLSGERAAVFRLDEAASRWKFEQELLPPGGVEEERFGEKVVIDRDFLAVSGLERVHVYRRGRDGQAPWVLCQSISRPEDLEDGVFGDPYGLGGGYLVAGSRRTSTVFARSFLFGNLESSATIADDESPRISISGGNFSEPRVATGLVEVVVSLSVAASVDIVVDLSLVSQSAEADRDFSLIDQQVTVPAGETRAIVLIELVGDAETEADETFSVQIDAVSRGAVEGGAAVVTITDTLPEVVVAHVVAAEGGGDPAFSLGLSKPSDRTVSVNYAAVPRSALSPDDFSLPDGMRSFAPGEVEKSIPFSVADDLVDESSEVFDLVLSQPDGVDLPAIRPLGEPFIPTAASAFDGAFLFMGSGFGEVQIYHVQPDEGMIEVDTIPSPRPSGNPQFGTVVAVDGETVAIASGASADYVDIFEPAADGSGEWQQLFWRNTSAPVVALAVSPDTVVAGTPEDGVNDLRIYRRGGDGQWRDGGTIAGDEGFGEVLALDGSQLAVSAPLGGYVRIYEIDFIGLATLSQEILPPAGVPAGAVFGSHLAIEDRVLLVGAPGNLGGSGMIHTYEQDDAGTWNFVGSISPPNP